MKRPQILAALAVCCAVILTGCSTGSGSDGKDSTATTSTKADADAYPVTIEHALGETTITTEPKVIATLGWADADMALSLGVVPAGAPAITWGGNDAQSTDFFDAKLAELGGTQPVRYSDADGAPISDIIALEPDLVLATNSGLTQEEYDKLSKAVPVVAYPDAPWTTSWQESLDLVGQALGRTELADEVRAETEESLAAAADDYPQIAGKSFIWAAMSAADTSKVSLYGASDNRPRILAELGLVNAPIVEELVDEDQFTAEVSAERAKDLESDIFITYGQDDSDRATFESDPLLSTVPAIASGAFVVSVDPKETLGLSAPSPLAIPDVIERFLPVLADAADKAK